MADPIVGIDLGTSNCVVALCDAQGQPRVLADERGTKIHPSVVSFHPNGTVVVGVDAKQRRIIDPRNTVSSVKRLIGRSFRSREIQTSLARVPYQIKEGQNQQPIIVTRGGEFAVPEVSAIVLDHVRNIAKKSLGQEIARAVVTVPASFTDAQRSATATAGAIAGITVVRVLNEPTAAALAYGFQRGLSRVIAVYDFGGGTLDVTILKLQDQVYEVLATAGDSFLGGDDIDEVLMEHMAEEFLAQHRVDVRQNEISVMRLRAVAEQTKIELSRRTRAIVKVDEIAYGPGGAPINLTTEITRDQLVQRAAPVIERSFAVCQEALRLAQLGPEGVEDVVLVGGTTKIPYLRERVSQFFQRAPRTDVNPEEAVALGAALQASALERILSRRPSTRQPPAGGSFEEAATGEKRNTAPLGAQPRPPGRPASAGPRDEKFDDMTGTSPKPLARITKPGAAAPPPIPTRGTASSKTLIGMPVAAEDVVGGPGPFDEITNERRVEAVFGKDDPFASITGTGAGAGAGTGTGTGSSAPDPFATLTRPGVVEDPFGSETRPGAPPLDSFGPPTRPGADGGHDPFAPQAQPTLTYSQGGPLGQLAPRPGIAPPPAPPAPPPPTPPSQQQTMLAVPAPVFAPPPPAPPPPATPPPAPPPSQQQTMMAAPAQQPTIVAGLAGTPQFSAPAPSPPFAVPRPPTVLDVTPRGLGIGTVAGYCEELIKRNARVPTEMRRMFTTSRDQQVTVRIRVCQGESRRIDDNLILGDLVLDGLPARPRGQTNIEVSFQLDASGILQVSARDAQTGQEQRASLDVLGAQSPAEVESARERFAQLRR